MAAPRNCLHCGDRFTPRKDASAYCPKDDCQRAHNTAKVRGWRSAVAYRENIRHEIAIERAQA